MRPGIGTSETRGVTLGWQGVGYSTKKPWEMSREWMVWLGFLVGDATIGGRFILLVSWVSNFDQWTQGWVPESAITTCLLLVATNYCLQWLEQGWQAIFSAELDSLSATNYCLPADLVTSSAETAVISAHSDRHLIHYASSPIPTIHYTQFLTTNH